MSTNDSGPARRANRLAGCASPYLLQHAHNPVDWYPWGEEAFEAARRADKPIFLSIGYAACHWCHVMERETFEDEDIAAMLNADFVCVKVDREERPDVDGVYMAATQIMTRGGGWPMSVFLTPELEPFYCGTYFPPDDRFGRPGFRTVITALAEAWRARREELLRSAGQLSEYVRLSMGSRTGPPEQPTPELFETAAEELMRAFDARHGGFGGAPKFPSCAAIRFLFRRYVHAPDDALLQAALTTLRKMACGGIHDHLGGGFHRYSVDEQWLVPHFEKMLYDNAQLAEVYLEAYQLTRDPFFRRVAEGIFAYQLRDMTGPDGAFLSTEDADSEGREGVFYLWRRDEALAVLGAEDGTFFCERYGIEDGGNFASHEPYHRGLNIPHLPHGVPPAEIEERLAPLRARLRAVRDTRVRPGLDDKVITAWNALMISALAKGYQVLREPRYRDAAERAADCLLDRMAPGGRLPRSSRAGMQGPPGYLDDYAFMVVALLDLYEATFEPSRIERARALAETMLELFLDERDGALFFSSNGHDRLIARDKPVYDGSEPSGNAMAAIGMLRLARLTGDDTWRTRAARIIEANHVNLRTAPAAALRMLCAADLYMSAPVEVAVVGDAEAAEPFLAALHGRFIPHKVVALLDPARPAGPSLPEWLRPLAARGLVDGKPVACVCRDHACRPPVTTPEALLEVLDEQ